MTRIEVQGGGDHQHLQRHLGQAGAADHLDRRLVGPARRLPRAGQPAQLPDVVHDRGFEPRRLLRRRGLRPPRLAQRPRPATGRAPPAASAAPRSRPAAAWPASRCSSTCTTTRSRIPPRACTSTPTTGNDTTGSSVYQAVIENVTFYNNGYAIQTDRPRPAPPARTTTTPASSCWR